MSVANRSMKPALTDGSLKGWTNDPSSPSPVLARHRSLHRSSEGVPVDHASAGPGSFRALASSLGDAQSSLDRTDLDTPNSMSPVVPTMHDNVSEANKDHAVGGLAKFKQAGRKVITSLRFGGTVTHERQDALKPHWRKVRVSVAIQAAQREHTRQYDKERDEALERASLAGVITDTEQQAGVARHKQGDTELYTRENLAKRHVSKRASSVTEAVHPWWELHMRHRGKVTASTPQRVTRKMYSHMSLRLYKAVVNPFVIEKAQESAANDWAEDSKGGPESGLDFDQLRASLSEMADLWTDGTDEAEMVSFLDYMWGKVTQETADGSVKWRPLDDVYCSDDEAGPPEPVARRVRVQILGQSAQRGTASAGWLRAAESDPTRPTSTPPVSTGSGLARSSTPLSPIKEDDSLDPGHAEGDEGASSTDVCRLTVIGAHFRLGDDLTVKLGNVVLSDARVISDSEIACSAPVALVTCNTPLVVTIGDGVSPVLVLTEKNITYMNAPSITSVRKSSSRDLARARFPGRCVTILGQNFLASSIVVLDGYIVDCVCIFDATQLVAMIPDHIYDTFDSTVPVHIEVRCDGFASNTVIKDLTFLGAGRSYVPRQAISGGYRGNAGGGNGVQNSAFNPSYKLGTSDSSTATKAFKVYRPTKQLGQHLIKPGVAGVSHMTLGMDQFERGGSRDGGKLHPLLQQTQTRRVPPRAQPLRPAGGHHQPRSASAVPGHYGRPSRGRDSRTGPSHAEVPARAASVASGSIPNRADTKSHGIPTGTESGDGTASSVGTSNQPGTKTLSDRVNSLLQSNQRRRPRPVGLAGLAPGNVEVPRQLGSPARSVAMTATPPRKLQALRHKPSPTATPTTTTTTNHATHASAVLQHYEKQQQQQQQQQHHRAVVTSSRKPLAHLPTTSSPSANAIVSVRKSSAASRGTGYGSIKAVDTVVRRDPRAAVTQALSRAPGVKRVQARVGSGSIKKGQLPAAGQQPYIFPSERQRIPTTVPKAVPARLRNTRRQPIPTPAKVDLSA